MTEELSEAEIKELEALDLEIIMEANKKDESVSGNNIPSEEQEENGEEGTQEIINANGGDITSSIPVEGDEGEFAPLTGVLLNTETGEAVNAGENDDSPY